ncbi:MAG: alpha/beta hydrolase [Chloroflexi bacterium HGW-Chloroflexi-10]|nr:MAG: alpha/beta hydrolase [Chloroflexi bacterium HGW-Chloroflexi-10]
MRINMSNWRRYLYFIIGVIFGLEWSNIFRPSLRSRLIYALIRVLHKQNVPDEIEKQRGYLDKLQQLVPPPLKLEAHPVNANGVPCEWVLPSEEISTQVVFYLHGGAYVTRMPVLHRNFLHHMAQSSQAQFLMVDYRLAPEFPFPAALADAITAYEWLLEQGWQTDQILFAGDSAGGGLTMATLLALRDLGKPLPAGVILISPWTDLAGTGESLISLKDEDVLLDWNNLQECAADYAAGESLSHPWVSPLYADFHGLPDTLIVVGGNEILMDDSTRLAVRMAEDGVEVEMKIEPYMGHVYPALGPANPEAQRALNLIADFIRKC